MNDPVVHAVIRCSRLGEDGPCGREQLIEACADGRVTETAPTLLGWCCQRGRWLCPFCVISVGSS